MTFGVFIFEQIKHSDGRYTSKRELFHLRNVLFCE